MGIKLNLSLLLLGAYFALTAYRFCILPVQLAGAPVSGRVSAASSGRAPLPKLVGDKKGEANITRPPLSELIGDKETNITGNVQFLLDFVIAGHPKCATTFLMNWLARHEEIQMPERELYFIKDGKPAKFIEAMYSLPHGMEFKRGYKAPKDIRLPHSLYLLGKYWPNANLIVGLRHPVLWFQSWYNYETKDGYSLGPAEDMVGNKLPSMVLFHNNLSQLGKTNVSDPSEALLLEPTKPPKEGWQEALFRSDGVDPSDITPMPQKVFLYVDLQLGDDNETRRGIFRQDLQSYLGLKRALFNRKQDKNFIANGKPMHIHICDDQYRQLRSELVEVGKAASEWILTYFLPNSDVVVSSPKYFEELLESWTKDPCDKLLSF